jgi:outer membrane cobalamin receptor
MEQLKAERAQARADRLAKIDATIDALRKKLENAIERDHCKMRFRQNQRDARIQALKAKADQSQGEIRRRLEARIHEVRREYEESPDEIAAAS